MIETFHYVYHLDLVDGGDTSCDDAPVSDDIAQTPAQTKRAARIESWSKWIAAAFVAAMILGGAFSCGVVWRVFRYGAGL